LHEGKPKKKKGWAKMLKKQLGEDAVRRRRLQEAASSANHV
jgi:hypothetical protein